MACTLQQLLQELTRTNNNQQSATNQQPTSNQPATNQPTNQPATNQQPTNQPTNQQHQQQAQPNTKKDLTDRASFVEDLLDASLHRWWLMSSVGLESRAIFRWKVVQIISSSRSPNKAGVKSSNVDLQTPGGVGVMWQIK